MRNIMIYTKHGTFRQKGKRALLRSQGGLLFFFTLFLCGTLLGCAVFKAGMAQPQSAVAHAAAFALQGGTLQTMVCAMILTGAIFAACVFASSSGLGICVLSWLPLIVGAHYAVLLSYLLAQYAVKGLGYFCLIVLPGALVRVCATLQLCSYGAAQAGKLASSMFFDEELVFDRTDYLKTMLTGLAFFIGSILLEYGCIALFGGLF